MADKSTPRSNRQTTAQSNIAGVSPIPHDENVANPEGETDDDLHASFDHGPAVPLVGEEISFDAEATSDSTERWEWTFGDDATGTGATTTHTYDSGGEKDVTLTVTDEDGATGTVEESVIVYRGVTVELPIADCSEDLIAVAIRGESDFDPAEEVNVGSLRFGSPTALAMGTGAAPVGSDIDGDDLRVWIRPDEISTGTETVRLAGRTDDGVPLVGTAEMSFPGE